MNARTHTVEQDARQTFAAGVRARLDAEPRRSRSQVARAANVSRAHLHRIEHGERWPSRAVAAALDDTLDANGALVATWRQGEAAPAPVPPSAATTDAAETAVADLHAIARHAEATDVTPIVLDALDATTHGLARDYSRVPSDALLGDVQTLARHVGALLGGRATLTQRRRLLVAGGWLALLAATLHVDLGQRRAATTARTVAASLARETEHGEIGAWAVEIDTWAALVDQQWTRAAALAAAGEDIAPRGTGAAVQLTAQSARAAARLGDGATVRAALDRAGQMIDDQPADRPPDHHFAFDARKLDYYTATALAWLDDPAGERHAREIVDRYAVTAAPRRLATARLDLGLILARQRRPEEAGHLGVLAVGSAWLVPSNAWRATELDDALDCFRSVPEVAELHALRQATR